MDALLSLGGGLNKVWAVRQWELETINALGWKETAWLRLDLAERARKVCAHKLGKWQEGLETERELRKQKASGR